MILKGVQNGDVTFRHFTFDDEDVVEQKGKYFYKVKYESDPLEKNIFTEDEFDLIECTKVKVLGGKKAKPIPGLAKNSSVVNEPKPENTKQTNTTTKSTNKKGSKKAKESTTDVNMDCSGLRFEYYVEECFADDANELKASLNKIGQDGWEMCGFDTNKNLFGKIHIIAIFKRSI